jgi:hypothetical protein
VALGHLRAFRRASRVVVLAGAWCHESVKHA